MRWFLALLTVLVVAAPATADTPVPLLPLPPGSVMIFSPGNADFLGYRIVLAPNGDAVAIDGAGRAQRPVSPQLTKTLFDDLAAAAPLSKLATSPCVPPPTVHAPLLITFANDTTPNIGCSADANEAALLNDVQAIAHALYVANYRSRAVSHFVTGSQAAGGAQVPTPSTPAPAPPSGGYGGYGHMWRTR
jgi:hypothetical protein